MRKMREKHATPFVTLVTPLMLDLAGQTSSHTQIFFSSLFLPPLFSPLHTNSWKIVRGGGEGAYFWQMGEPAQKGGNLASLDVWFVRSTNPKFNKALVFFFFF